MGPLSYSALLAAAAVGTSALSLPRAANLPRATKHKPFSNLLHDLTVLLEFSATVTVDPEGVVASWQKDSEEIIENFDWEKVCNLTKLACADTPEPDSFLAVAGIDLNGAGLGVGLELDDILPKLQNLTFFHANTNGFIGTIPNVSESKYLFEIDVSNNNMSGPFPMTIFDAPLTFLDIRHNSFSGEIPDNLFTDTEMDVIFLNNNNFTGTIPPFGDTKEGPLYITFGYNQLTGEIPADHGNNVNLIEIQFRGNLIEGNVPEELCALKNVTVIDVSDNPGLCGELGPECVKAYKNDVLNITLTNLVVPDDK